MKFEKHTILSLIFISFQVTCMEHVLKRHKPSSISTIEYAIDNNDLKKIELLWKNNKNLIDDSLSFSILSYALRNKKWDSATYLIELGAAIENEDQSQQTTLHLMCKFLAPLSLFELVFNKHPTINLEKSCPQDQMPLALVIPTEVPEITMAGNMFDGMKIIEENERKIAIALFLVKKGASILAPICRGAKKIIFTKCDSFFLQFACNILFEAIKYALNSNQKQRIINLFQAVGHYKNLWLAINFQDHVGNTLLHYIAQSDPRNLRNAKAKLLFDHKANPNICNYGRSLDGEDITITPLDIALKQGDKALFSLLIAHGANISYSKAIMVAKKSNKDIIKVFNIPTNRLDILTLLLNAAFGNTLPAQLIVQDDYNYFAPVLENGFSPNEYDYYHNTLLHHVAYKKEEIYNREIDEIRRKMAILLIRKEACVNAQNVFGLTPLHLAINSRNIPVVQELLANGADIVCKDNQGYNSFDYALNNHPQALWQFAGVGSVCAYHE